MSVESGGEEGLIVEEDALRCGRLFLAGVLWMGDVEGLIVFVAWAGRFEVGRYVKMVISLMN